MRPGDRLISCFNWILLSSSVIDDKANMIFSASAVTAYVGISSTGDQNKESRSYPVSQIFVHPDYRTGPAGSGHADVALLQLTKSVDYVDGIQNACIDYSESIENYYIVAGRVRPFHCLLKAEEPK